MTPRTPRPRRTPNRRTLSRWLGRAAPLLALSLIASLAWADAAPTRIVGTVRAGGSGAPVPGARVSAGESVTRTDHAGHFTLRLRRAGRVRVSAQHPGFRRAQRTVTAAFGRTTRVDFRLRRIAVAKLERKKVVRVRAYGMGAAPASRAGIGKGSYGGYGGRVARRGRLMMRPGPRMDRGASREGYAHTPDGDYHQAAQRPLSTFSIDVDTASYSNVRRFIQQRRLPPADAVRIEELLNYFPYGTPGPSTAHPFGVAVELTEAPWNPKHRLARIAVQGRKVPVHKLPPANLVFLVDVSGSMFSANKLPLLKRSLAMLTHQLRPQDRVSIVVYAGAAGLVLPPTPGSEQDRILRALDGLRAGGSTAGGAGIRLAYQVARKAFVKGGNNRVILCTDGDFNVGQSSDGALVRQIEKERRSGVFLTVLGFGAGNYQDAKMQLLADKGNGHHAYIDSLLEARKVLVEEMGGTLLTIAKDVKIQVEFNPRRVKSYRLIGYANRKLAARDFADDTKDAGELGAGHHVTALYELIPADGAAAPTKLRYQRAKPTAAADSGELMHVKLRWKAPTASKSQLASFPVSDLPGALAKASRDHRFAASVAAFGMLLRKSKHLGGYRWTQMLALAQGAVGADRGGHRAAFVQLASQASRAAERARGGRVVR